MCLQDDRSIRRYMSLHADLTRPIHLLDRFVFLHLISYK
jgi:hypothetical protein